MPHSSIEADKEKFNSLTKDFPSFIKSYFNVRQIRLGYKTMISYAYDYHIFIDFLKENNPMLKDIPTKDFTVEMFAQITLDDVEEFISYLKRTCDKNSSVYRRLSSLSSLFTFLQKKDFIEKNPFLLVDREKKNKHKIIRLENDETLSLKYSIKTGYGFTDSQIMRNHHNIRDYAMFTVLLNEGLRVSELINIDIMDLDLLHKNVGVVRKGGDYEKVFLSDESIKALTEYLSIRNSYLTEETKEETALFLSQAHRRMSVRNVEVLLKKYMHVSNPSKEEIIHVHSLRATFATDFYEESSDLMLLRDKMGHKSIQTTTIYADVNEKNLEKSRNIIEKSRNRDTSNEEK